MSVCDESKHTRREKHTRTRHTEPRRAAPLASFARSIASSSPQVHKRLARSTHRAHCCSTHTVAQIALCLARVRQLVRSRAAWGRNRATFGHDTCP